MERDAQKHYVRDVFSAVVVDLSQNTMYGKVRMEIVKSNSDIGQWVRKERKKQGLTQKKLSGLIGVSERFIIELEKGKPTAEVDKVLHVLNHLGATVTINSRGEQ